LLQSFPLVYALLNGKTEEIYVALFQFILKILPLDYQNLTIITDFELAQINVIKLIFGESVHQGCYFHFCQVMNLPIINLITSNLCT